jgi:hypothetical protein
MTNVLRWRNVAEFRDQFIERVHCSLHRLSFVRR